jgi:hypothetical protein
MNPDQLDPALQAANLALTGRRMQRAASRFASIQLRGIDEPPRSDRQHVIWEVAAVASIAMAAVLTVFGVWML